MSYKNEHIDHIFFRMKESLPSSGFFYYIIVILKLAPLFLLSHTAGYTTPVDPNCTLHTYFKYLSMTFYIENSISNVITITGIFFLFNLGMIGLMIYYLLQAKKVQEIDENYGSQNSLDLLFLIFSNVAFFKYVLLCQFFYEMNFLPLICFSSYVDINKVQSIFSSDITQASFDNVCTSSNFAIFIFLAFLNIVIDTGFNYILNSRFFDFNILSSHFWNTYPNFLLSFLFIESFSQVFFILFLNYENETYKLLFSIYVYLIVFIHIVRFFIKKEFFTLNNLPIRKLLDVTLTMVFIAQVLIQILYYVLNIGPSDTNIIYMLIFELILGNLKYSIFHKKDNRLVEEIITTNLSKLNDKNIYEIFIYLITEFAIFSDVNYKFDDAKLDLFLENYVHHLKTCEEAHCPCKNYLKKSENSNHTIKTGFYTTVINYTQLGQEQNGAHEEYLLNKFFNVLSANVSTSIKFTNNNVNINSITDSNKQKLIYNLRIRLINAVKKLIANKLEHLFNGIDHQYSQNFSQETKHFIRINYFSLHLLCNKNYYKTFFQYHQFLTSYQKKFGKNYRYYLIYYFYLKKLGIKEYNDHINFLKSIKKDVSMFNMDFRKMLSMCVKFYEVEDKLLNNITDYLQFITYFEKDEIVFDSLLEKVKIFKTNYKNMTEYIRYFFKNEKVNNLFICSKIILFYKILQFSIPQSLHNKLLVTSQEDEGTKSYSETNYYIIASYIKGEFKIKFISHELLIILEYGEEELRGEDFHVLMPNDMRESHKYLLINEIKNKNNHNITYKEIFLVGKKKTSILFDLHFKILLDLKGDITVLCVFNVAKPKNDQKCCFVCMENSGEIIAMNREFEEYLLLSMKVLDYIRIDAEKTVLQSLGPRIRAFFKEEENHNSEFYERFDYELYLQGLFGEEFEALRDKNEILFKKKHSRWEQLKEVIRKGRYYNKYIDVYVKMRSIKSEKFLFIKYYIKASLSIKTFEPYSTTLSMINQVKLSKREMVRLSSNKIEDNYQPTKIQTVKENPEAEPLKPKHPSMDFLNESQSALSSAALMLKEKNSKRLFKTKQKNFKFTPKGKNILILIIFLVSFSLCSIIYNIIALYIKFGLLQKTHDVMLLNLDVSILKNSLFYLTSGIISLAMIQDEILPYKSLPDNFNSFENNTIHLVDSSIKKIADILYNINYLNNVYYNIDINNVLSSIDNNFTFIFNNGLIYQKGNIGLSLANNVITYKEISTFQKNSFHFLNNFQLKNLNLHFHDLILFNKIFSIQDKLSTNNIFSEDDTFLFYLIHNIYSNLDPFLENVKKEYLNFQIEVVNSISLNLLIIRVFELLMVVFIILMEIFFVYLGYEKAKKKMRELKTKVRDNNVELTIKKIEEYIKFCNTFNVYSLYLIADFEVNPAMKDNEAFLMNNAANMETYDKKVSAFNPNYTSDRLLYGKEQSLNIGRKQSKKSGNPFGNTVINQKFLAGELKNSIPGTSLIKNIKVPINEIKIEEPINEVNDKNSKVGKGLAKLENMKRQKSKDAFFKKDNKIPFSSQHAKEEYDNHEVPNELQISSGSLIGKKIISVNNLNFNTSGSKINYYGNEQGDFNLKNSQLSQNGQLEQLRQNGHLVQSQNFLNDISQKYFSQAQITSGILSYGNINPSDISMYGLEVPNEKSDIENEITIKKNLILSNEDVLRRSRDFEKNDNINFDHIDIASPIRDFSSVRLIDNSTSKELKNIPPHKRTKFYEDENQNLSESSSRDDSKIKFSTKKFSSNKDLKDTHKKYDYSEGIALKSSGNLENKYSGQFTIKSVLRNHTETNNNSLLKYNGIYLEKSSASHRNSQYHNDFPKSSSGNDDQTFNNHNQASEVEDSNGQLLQNKDNDDPIHLLRREASKKKIQWTDQNVKRFYSPDQGLNGAESKLTKKLKKKNKKNKKSDNSDIDERNKDFDHRKPPNHLQTIVEDQSMISPEIKSQIFDLQPKNSPLIRDFTVVNIEQDVNLALVDSNFNTETPMPSQFNEPLLENEFPKSGSNIKLSLNPNSHLSTLKTKKESTLQGTNIESKINESVLSIKNSTIHQDSKLNTNEIKQTIKLTNPAANMKTPNSNSESVENLREFKKLNDGTIDKVRKNAEIAKHKGMKDEEIEQKVEKIIHSNLTAKIILTVFGLGFLILYMIAGLSNIGSMSKLDSLQNSSLIYLEKVQALNSLILKYKFNLITNSTKIDLQPQFEKVYENINNIIKVKQTSEFSIYSRTYELEQLIDSKLACDYISIPFSKLSITSMNSEYEKSECVLIAEQMNKNGLIEAYSNILNTMQQLNTDMLDLQDLSEESILGKMYDSLLFNLVLDLDYTFRKYDLLLTNYILDDFEDFNTNLLFNEKLFSYTSIILNIVFAGTSLILIILPIKYIETMISWLLHKLRDSE